MKQLLASIVLISFLFTGLKAGSHKIIERYNRLTGTWATYPEMTIRMIQETPHDSLLVADALQNTIPARWTLQSSPHIGDTVVVTALVMVPAKVLTYTNKGYTMLLFDTASTNNWRGLFARATSDTATHISDGFMLPEAGDIIRITGVISDFPTVSMNSATQFQPIPGIAIEIVGNMPVPQPAPKSVSDFYTGIFSGGKIWYSTGEPYEGAIVELTNLTIDAKVNTSRGTFSMVDASNNQITMYDASRYFTLKGTSTDHPIADPVWTNIYNSPDFINSKISKIRGFITVASGSEGARGYRICPIYYGDIEFGSLPHGLLSGTKFNDLNRNGIREAGEPGISNWQINLSGEINVSTITDINGDYQFAFLDSGSYIITEEQKPGWMQIFPPSGSHDIMLGIDDTLNGLNFGNIELNTILMRKFLDADGNFSTTNDRSPHLWSMSLYKDSISANSLITSVPSNSTLLANNLTAGTYIAVEADSARWSSLGKISDGISYSGTFNADTIILSTGQTKTIDFINYQPRIVVKKKADTDGNFTTTADRYSKLWNLLVYKDSVSETNLVSHTTSADSLVVYTPEPGNYIAVEADSIGWIPLGKIVNSLPTAGTAKTHSFNYVAGTIRTVEFVNFNPNKVLVKKYYDEDGLLYTSNDRLLKQWNIRLYKETMSMLVASIASSESLLVDNLGDGTYIVTESDSAGWVHIGKSRNGVLLSTTSRADTFTIAGGKFTTVDFINTAPVVTVRKLSDTDGNFATSQDRSFKKWNLTLYQGSVAPGNIVAMVASAESLSIRGLVPGFYIAREADSLSWSHIGTILNGVAAPSQEREISFTIVGSESYIADFVNASPGSITIRKFADQDGSFLTVGDRTLKAWSLSLHKDTITSGIILGSVDSAPSLTVSGLPSGRYVAVEADSASWQHISTIVDGISQGGTVVRSWTIDLHSGESHTVDFVNFDLDRKKVWIATTNCEWNVGSNWQPPGVPIPGDTIIVASGAQCSLLIPSGASIGTISVASAETVIVRGGTSIAIGGDALIEGALLVETDGDPTINVAGNWVTNGSFKPEKSKVIFSGKSEQIVDGGEFYNVQVGNNISVLNHQIFSSGLSTARVKTNGDWLILGSLTLNANLDAKGDTISIINASDTSLVGDGQVIDGSIQRNIGQGSLNSYQFESKYSFIQFDGNGTYPVNITMTVYPDTSPITFSSTWRFINSSVDTANNRVWSDSITGFSLWTFGMINMWSGDQVVNRVYSIETNGGVGYRAMMSLAYSHEEFMPLVEESLLIFLTTKDVTVVQDNQSGIPQHYALEQAYPNPFNPTTTIKYSLPEDCRVTLCVYNVLGQMVATLADESQSAGFKSTVWNAGSNASGMYFYKLDAISVADPSRSFSQVKKMVLVK